MTILSLFTALAVSLTSYVQPFVGTTNFGATNPGAVLPSGMMSVSPFNVMGSKLNTWDKDSRWWSTPYVYENKYFTGFSHVNLSGVGCPDLGSLLTMPTSGAMSVDYHLYGSEYTDEYAEPGYYSLTLSSHGIKAEATATKRSSIERYTFPGGEGHIILNLGEGLTNESGAYVMKVSPTEIRGMKVLGTFCYNGQAVFPIYFVLRVDKVPSSGAFFKKQRPMTAEAAWDSDAGKYKLYTKYERELAGDDIGYVFTFKDLGEGEQICVRMGVSFVSMDNALLNLETEQNGKTFDTVRTDAHDAWEEDLGRIQVEGGSLQDRQIFYTALYHALLHPNVASDVNGEYPLMEGGGKGKVQPGHERYTVFSLWDTYRNVHQLLSLVYPERQADMLTSMIDMSKEWGWMPKWELYSRETFTMEGDPAIPVIVDSYLKGFKDIDIDWAYQAFIKSATTPGKDNRMRPDIDPYIERGYIPLNWFSQDFSGDNSVSHALEYYVADNALSILCSALAQECDDPAKKEDFLSNASLFRTRSLGWRNYYSEEFGTLRPINKDGSFLTPFNPEDGADFSNAPGFHEGSAWNYTFYVPHDVEGLAALMGGKKAFVETLQHVFDDNLFDPANEPDIAYPYLFSRFKGEEYRTQKTVREVLRKNFTTLPDGIPGNDDTGTMSSWALFSMMGFYPDCPGEPYYTLTSPFFEKVTITLDPGLCFGNDTLVITKHGGLREEEGLGEGYDRITSMLLGGKKLRSYRISHEELTRSGTLSFNCRAVR